MCALPSFRLSGAMSGERDSGAAQRLREPRLCPRLQHERMAVRMVLAETPPPRLWNIPVDEQCLEFGGAVVERSSTKTEDGKDICFEHFFVSDEDEFLVDGGRGGLLMEHYIDVLATLRMPSSSKPLVVVRAQDFKTLVKLSSSPS